jgi:hypothetical protein
MGSLEAARIQWWGSDALHRAGFSYAFGATFRQAEFMQAISTAFSDPVLLQAICAALDEQV